MFEKEAEEYLFYRLDPKAIDSVSEFSNKHIEEAIVSSFKDGAEYGYKKANEWHYPLNCEYPKEYEDILICFLTEDDMKDYVRGWCEFDFENGKHIFKYLNVLGTQYLEKVIAWKEIVPPKGSE